MMGVKIKTIRKGLHPHEVVVAIQTLTGAIEKLVVHHRMLKNDSIDIGYPINSSDEGYLVELPQETTSGAWRVWVSKDNVQSYAPA